MKNGFALFLVMMMLSFANNANASELYSDKPHCADIKNETADTAFIGIRTNFYQKPDGTRSYFEEVLHLKNGQSKQICAKGPFYEGHKVILMVKSFFPLFECKTKLTGTIYVREKKRADGGRDFYATCAQ